jgi:hypothetical protein
LFVIRKQAKLAKLGGLAIVSPRPLLKPTCFDNLLSKEKREYGN